MSELVSGGFAHGRDRDLGRSVEFVVVVVVVGGGQSYFAIFRSSRGGSDG